jgi:hypothetical protein
MGAPVKHNFDLIRQLYMSGYEPPEILKMPQFNQLSPFYLNKKIYAERWHETRKMLREQAKALGDIELVDIFKAQGDKHYRFMVQQLEKHREIIKKRELSDTLKGQRENLSLLNDYDSLARRVLGLSNDDSPADRGAMAVRAMISLHVNGPSRLPMGSSATLPLPENQNVTTGILTQANGVHEVEMNPQIVESRDNEGNEGDGNEKTPASIEQAGGWDGEIRAKGT